MLKFNILTVKQKRNKSHQENLLQGVFKHYYYYVFLLFLLSLKSSHGELTIKFV